MMVMQSKIEVRVQQRFMHRWKRAPKHRDYLRTYHPHNFEFRLELQVFEDDRELEFHDVQDWLWQVIFDNVDAWHDASCETIARHVVTYAKEKYGNNREIEVEVWEDTTVGGKVKYAPDTDVTKIARMIDEALKKKRGGL